jgi:CRISPR/Cas system-associated endoribonuclease Cas2
MKRIINLLLLSIITSLVSAQEKFTIKESKDDIGAENSLQNVYKISFPKASKEIAEKELKSFIKDNNGKTNQIHKQLFGDNLSMSDITTNTFDLYAKFFESDNGSLDILIGIDLGGSFLSSSSHPEISNRLDKYLNRIANSIFNQTLTEQIKAEEKKLKQLEKELQKLEKQKENLKTDIEEFKEKILKAESEIDVNVKAQVETRKSIEEQSKVLETIKNKQRN